MFAEFGPEPTMQLYNRGIRRRLAPMLGNDLRRITLAYSLLFTLPGTPVLRYGEEIGMGDLLSLARAGSDPHADAVVGGAERRFFDRAARATLVRPVISEGEYGYERVNVEQQRRDPHSLLNTVERMIRLRKEHPEFGFGECTIVDLADPAVFGIRASWQANTTIAVHNLADRPATILLDLQDDEASHVLDALGGDRFERRSDGKVEVKLEPYAVRWLRLRRGQGERADKKRPRRTGA